MSIALAVRNDEGVVLAADSHMKTFLGGNRYAEHRTGTKIQFLRGHKAALILFPIVPTSDALADKPDPAPACGEDFEDLVAGIYAANAQRLKESAALRPDWPSPPRPKLLLGASLPRGVLLRKWQVEHLADGQHVDGNRDFDQDGHIGVAEMGWGLDRWGFDAGKYLDAVPWRVATTVAWAEKLIATVFLEFLADYEKSDSMKQQLATPEGRSIGGPVDIVTITSKEIRMNTYGSAPA